MNSQQEGRRCPPMPPKPYVNRLCDIGAQCGAIGVSSQVVEPKSVKPKSVKPKSSQIRPVVKTVTSILKPSTKPAKKVTFQGGSYTKIYYQFEPANQLNYPYKRPVGFYFPSKQHREYIPRVQPITEPYTLGPYGERKVIPKPSVGRGRMHKAKMEEIKATAFKWEQVASGYL